MKVCRLIDRIPRSFIWSVQAPTNFDNSG